MTTPTKRQKRGKYVGLSTTFGLNRITKTILVRGLSVAATNTYLGAHLAGRQESGQSRTSGKGEDTN